MLIMENSEEVLQILERFTKLKQKDIPKELDEYLCYVAKTGDTVYRWANIKYLFREKLMHVIKDFHDSTPSVDDLPQYPNVDPFNYETMKSALLERLELFNAAPFTVQRLCELLTDPRKQYCRIDKYMRALEKNILVVSTVEPGRKQPDSENGDSLDSVVNGDISLEVNVDIDMENESIFGMDTQNTSSASAASSSSNRSDDSISSSAKKAKIEAEETSSDKSKSGSDSDESSDDSDNQNSREDHKEGQMNLVLCETDNSKELIDDIGSEKNEQNSDIPRLDKDDVSNKEKSNEITKHVEMTTKIVESDQVEKKSVQPGTSEEDQVHSVECLEAKNEELTESSKTQNNEIPCLSENLDSSECNPPEDIKSSLENSNENVTESRIVHSQPILDVTTEHSDEKSQQQPPEPKQITEESKIPEQMPMEDAQVAPVVTAAPQVTSSSTVIPVAVEQTSTDQPMDENLEPAISSSCTGNSSPCIDEVIMQSESDMATETVKVGDDKTGPTGMDVDDISQEEAMDQ